MNPSSVPSTHAVVLPPAPRLVLRVGFAGSQAVAGDDAVRLAAVLERMFQVVGHQLAVLAPGVPVGSGQVPRVAASYSRECPVFRLITGLCEGADEAAAEALGRVRILPDARPADGTEVRCLHTELAAVLPFDVETYRASRPAWFHPQFDRRVASCAYVMELDGWYERPVPDTPLARNRRRRAYRAQSALLLRHSDLLVAAADLAGPTKAGGTLETVREAGTFGLPVVFVHLGTGRVHLIAPGENLHSVLAEPPPSEAEWQDRLRSAVTGVVADPDVNPEVPIVSAEDHRAATTHGERLLQEYFQDAAMPPLDPVTGRRKPDWREAVWNWVEGRFSSGKNLKGIPTLEPFAAWRHRATELNRQYSGLYRGAFLLNYLLAVVAVLLATLSLLLLGAAVHSGAGEHLVALAQVAGHATVETAHPTTPAAPTNAAASTHVSETNRATPGMFGTAATPASSHASWLLPTLLVLGLAKFVIVRFIAVNTHRANHEEWNDRAVDYRYLAERLRALNYLPLAGSFQPPTASPPQFASRVVRQSAVDWLCEAIIRGVSPAQLPSAATRAIPTYDRAGTLNVHCLRLDPLATVERVRDRWIGEQAVYHARSARTMNLLHVVAEKTGSGLGKVVIGFVAVDVAIVSCELAGWIPSVKWMTPWLIFTAAVLPAAVAALNGIRFQSECRRLAERSAVMRVMLGGRPSEPVKEKVGGWVQGWRTVGLVCRHLAGHAPEPAEPPLDGGRWAEADRIAKRIVARRADPSTDLGGWCVDVLGITEDVAEDFVQEVAEWSVLYAKELPEPG